MEDEYNWSVELRTDFNVTDSGLATYDDVSSLHNIDGEMMGDGVTVVVMDSGIDESHELLADTDVEHVDIVGGGPTDNVGHGTACAGLIAQVAPGVDMISLRIFGDSGQTDGRTIADAYDWLVRNSDRYDVVNMSWGAQRKIQSLDDMHNTLMAQDVDAVVAAGNTAGRGGSPATASRAFSAGAVTANGKLTRFSSYNPNYDNPDVVAVGKNNRLARASNTDMGTVLDDSWVKASGTSFAAPIVTGLVARVREHYGDPSVVDVFESGARDIAGTPEDGAGVADYSKTISAIDGPETETVSGAAWNFRGNDTIYIGADWVHTGNATITKLDEDDDSITIRVSQADNES